MAIQVRYSIADIIGAAKAIAKRADCFQALLKKHELPTHFRSEIYRLGRESEEGLEATWRAMKPHLQAAGVPLASWAYIGEVRGAASAAHGYDSLLQHCSNNGSYKREALREAFAWAANHLIPLNQRHAQEWKALKKSLPHYPPPKRPEWRFSWSRELRVLRSLLPRAMVRGIIFGLLLWGAIAWREAANAYGVPWYIRWSYVALLIACFDEAKMLGMAFVADDAGRRDEAIPWTYAVTSPLGCVGVLLPFSPLAIAIQALGLMYVLNYAYKGALFIIGKGDAAKRDYTDEISELLIGLPK